MWYVTVLSTIHCIAHLIFTTRKIVIVDKKKKKVKGTEGIERARAARIERSPTGNLWNSTS